MNRETNDIDTIDNGKSTPENTDNSITNSDNPVSPVNDNKDDETTAIQDKVDIEDSVRIPTEDNLELHSLSRKERKKVKRKKYHDTTVDMSRLQRLGYLMRYYKSNFLIPIFLVVVIILIVVTIYNNSRPIALSYVVLNRDAEKDFDDSFEEEYRTTYSYEDNFLFKSELGYSITFEGYENDYSSTSASSVYSTFPMQCYNNYFDVIITDEEGAKYCAYQQIMYSVKNALDCETYDLVKDRIYTAEYGNTSSSETGVAIDISDTAFAKSLNLGYTDVYIAFPGSTEQNRKHAKMLLNFILDLEIQF